MKSIHAFYYALIIMFLAACGGGGSDSGGTAEANNDGVFVGTIEATASTIGLSQTESAPLQIVVQDNAVTSITIDDESTTGSFPIDGNNITVSVDASTLVDIDDDVSCSGPIDLIINFAGDTLDGTLAASLDCMFEGAAIPVDVTGTLTATR